MADLSYTEKQRLEKLLDMGSGYVLDFTDRTFAEFVADSVQIKIYDTKYAYNSGSKANRLRAFWTSEPNSPWFNSQAAKTPTDSKRLAATKLAPGGLLPRAANHLVGKLLTELIEYCRPEGEPTPLFLQCEQIAARLMQASAVQGIEAITPEGSDRSFDLLAREIQGSIDQNEPEAGLDRLHTYTTRLLRQFAEKRGIPTERDKPLHSILGEYIKALRAAGLIESEMTDRILKSAIGILESFNKVRNNHSLAHDNAPLNHDESLLIFTSVCGSIRFIRALEKRANVGPSASDLNADSDIPF